MNVRGYASLGRLKGKPDIDVDFNSEMTGQVQP